jgi:hypothetical protein
MKSLLAILSVLTLFALSANATEPAAHLFRKALEEPSTILPPLASGRAHILELKVIDSLSNSFRKIPLYTVEFTTSDGASTTCNGSIAPLNESARRVLLDRCEVSLKGTTNLTGLLFEGSVGL